MNAKAILRAVPRALMDSTAVAWSMLADAARGEDEAPLYLPLAPHEAGRVALEMVMVMRGSQGDSEQFNEMMREIFSDLSSPQQVVDVTLSLTGMVAVLAKEEDLTRFGDFILKHEAAELP